MKGKFIVSPIKYLLCLVFILAGSFTAVRFSLWGVGEVQTDHASSAIFCFVFAVIGLLFGFLSIFVFNFNRNAFFTAENGKIDARFSWSQELHTDIINIRNAELRGKHLKLFVEDNIVWIYNLNNAKEICEYILSQISKSEITVNIKEIDEKHQKSKKSYTATLIATILLSALMFINIAWCVILTDGKELVGFSDSDNIVFLAFIIAEIFTVSVIFFLANKCGKKLELVNVFKAQRLYALAIEHKYDDLDKYPSVLNKKYFDHYTYRIVIFSPEENVFAYMLERFDIKTISWIHCYASVKGFEILSELYEDLDDVFNDVILED